MKVILIQTIESLGTVGDEVNVAKGYARNYLIPQNKAIVATPNNRKVFERQLAQRLDSLFAGGDSIGLGALLSGDGKSQDWQDLGSVVSRTLGLPSGAGVGFERHTASMEKLDYFASGSHRD